MAIAKSQTQLTFTFTLARLRRERKKEKRKKERRKTQELGLGIKDDIKIDVTEVKTIVKRIFNFFNLPIDLKEDNSLYSVKIGQYFLDHIEPDITKTLELLKENFIFRL